MGVVLAVVLGMAAVVAVHLALLYASEVHWDDGANKWHAIVNAALTIIAAFGSGYLAALNSN